MQWQPLDTHAEITGTFQILSSLHDGNQANKSIILNEGNELKMGFKLPQLVLKQDPNTNVVLKVSFGNKKKEDQAIFKVEIND